MTDDEKLSIIKSWGYSVEIEYYDDGKVGIAYTNCDRYSNGPGMILYESLGIGIQDLYNRVWWIVWINIMDDEII